MEENIFNARQGVRKRRSQWIAFGVFKLLSYSIVLILFCILGFIIYKGIGVINWKFLTSPPQRRNDGRRHLAGYRGYFLFDDRQCIVCFSCGRDERYLYERICSER